LGEEIFPPVESACRVEAPVGSRRPQPVEPQTLPARFNWREIKTHDCVF
jgi:hypothetical protein